MWINSGNGYSTSRVLLTENKLDKEGSVTSQKVKFSSKPIKNIWIYRWDTRDESDTLETSGFSTPIYGSRESSKCDKIKKI